MTAPFVARTKSDRAKLAPAPDAPGPRSGLLDCGHAAKGYPKLSNPDRWWCCNGWQGVGGANGSKKLESEPRVVGAAQPPAETENGTGPPAAAEPSGSAPRARKKKWTHAAAVAAVQAFAREHGRTPSTADIKAGSVPTWDTAKKLFGGWPELCDAAGLARPKVGRRSKTEEIGLAEGERRRLSPRDVRADVDRESRVSDQALTSRRVGEPDVVAELFVAFGKLAHLLRLTALMYERHADVFKEVAADLEELAR